MSSYDFTRLKRLILIYRVVLVALTGLLIFMAFNFQKLFAALGAPSMFTRSVIWGIGVQLVMFYPAWLLARYDSSVEFESALVGIDGDRLMQLRKKRMIGDIWKLCVMGFFVVFVALTPDASKARALSSLLAAVYFGFLLISITYFQLFNYLAARKRRETVS